MNDKKNEMLLANIRELCRKNHITVNHLEKMTGMGTGTISRWNKASPSLDKIYLIAQFFRISIDKLVGYVVEGDPPADLDEKTSQVIGYLTDITIEADENESFWKDYKSSEKDHLMVDHLKSMKDEMSRLLCGCDETGYYLLEILYLLNAQYDYETQINLYLVPDESTVPVLECSENSALRFLYVNAIKKLEMSEAQKTAREKADMQRERILKKRQSKAADI